MIQADSHVHSSFSSDSSAPVQSMVQRAYDLKFSRFYLTDHMDYDFPVVNGLTFQFDPVAYFRELNLLKERWQEHLPIYAGVEVGLQPQSFPAIQTLLFSYPFDVVIGSVHLAEGLDPYDPDFWKERSVEEAMQFYLEATRNLLDSCPAIDILGHLDYAIRYAPTRSGYPSSKNQDLLDAILNLLIAKGIALEVNTSAIQKTSCPNPDFSMVERYYKLGGRLITIGSDAHSPEYLGASFSLVRDRLFSIGFREYAVYEKRLPVLFPL